MAEPLAELFKTPAPRQAVILARGPSLVRYDQARHPGATVFGVNDLGVHREGQAHADHAVDYSVYIDGHLLAGHRALGTPLRPKMYADAHGGSGYYWDWPRGTHDRERDAFGRTGSAALALCWLWGCRDIWIYGMDAYPDCADASSAITGVVNGVTGYRSTVDRQKRLIAAYGMNGALHWAHLEKADDVRT